MNILIIALGAFLVLVVSPIRTPYRQIIEIVIAMVVIFFLRGPIEFWILERAKISASEVISGNVFSVRGSIFSKRHLVLAGTALPSEAQNRKRAKEALELYLSDRNLDIIILAEDGRTAQPWPVLVSIDSISLNQKMINEGFLLAAVSATNPESAVMAPTFRSTGENFNSTPSYKNAEIYMKEQKGLSSTKRYLLWISLGFFGSIGLGVIFAGNPRGCFVFVAIAAGASWSIASSLIKDISIWPPIIGLLIVFLFSGSVAKNERIRKERNSMKNSRQ